MQRLSIIFAIIATFSLLAACVPGGHPANAVDAKGTVIAAALTIAAETGSAIPTATPSPTPTPVRTQTETPFPVSTLETLFSSSDPGTALPPISTYVKVSQIDGMIQIYIPQGCFMMGTNDEAYPSTYHQHRVCLGAFWMDQTLVSNAMFARCVQAGTCTYIFARPGYNPRYADPAFASWPVIFVKWTDAEQYCQRVGRRLPTEAEWEDAARGPNGDIYPWGLPNQNTSASFNESTQGDTVSVYTFGVGASPYGILSMAGNVRQWIADWYAPNYYVSSPVQDPQGPASGKERVLRGGTYGDYLRWNLAVHRFSHDPKSPGNDRGFRCVEDANEGN